MMILQISLALLSVGAAVPNPVKDIESKTISHSPLDTTLTCGNWATGSRTSAQNLQSQLKSCNENLWGKSFTVPGTDQGNPATCIGLACDYVSANNFHHTQISLCNDNTGAMTMTCDDVATWAQKIIDGCCTSGDGLSGQIYLGDGTNIDISYSTACHSAERPSDPGPGMGQCLPAK